MGKKAKKAKKSAAPDLRVAPDQTTAEVQLGGRPIRLTLPHSYALRCDVTGAVGRNLHRGYAAALAICMPHMQRPPVSYEQHGHNPLSYGGAVIDHLVEQGITIEEILDAGAVAHDLCLAGLVTNREVKEAEGNSSAREGSTA